MATSVGFVNTQTPARTQSRLNGMVVLSGGVSTSVPSANTIADGLADFNLGAVLGLTEVKDLISAIMYFPLDLRTKFVAEIPPGETSNIGWLTAWKTASVSITVRRFPYKEYSSGYFIGEHFVTDTGEYTDIEPYRKLDVWLPFYGTVNIPLSRVVGKYVGVLMTVDFNTGEAIYYIVSKDSSFSSQLAYPPFLYGSNFSGLKEIISTHTFQLGYKYPIGNAGYNEYLRNTAIGLATTVAGFVAGAYAFPSSAVGRTKVTTFKNKNPKTNRLNIQSRLSEEFSANRSDLTEYKVSRISNSVAHSLHSLSHIQSHGSVANANNQMVMYTGSWSLQFIYTTANLVPYSSSYLRLYGRPLADTRKLSAIHGYTEISNVHLEYKNSDGTNGTGFNGASREELAMIESLLTEGVILP